MAMKEKYDMFISYRREGGAQYARILQLMLRQKGYQVFLDYDELTDGIFSDHIKNAIKETPIFILILSKNAIDRCTNENDWLRQEILFALENNKKIIPVNPDATFNGLSQCVDAKLIPESIRRIVNEYQHSDIRFGQALGATVDMMVKNRIEPILGTNGVLSKNDFTYISKEKTPDNNSKRLTRAILLSISAILLILAAISCYWKYTTKTEIDDKKELAEVARLRDELHDKYNNMNLYLSRNLSVLQISTIDHILKNMREVKKGVLWMGQFEFSKREWFGIQGIEYDAEDSSLPMTEISFGDIYIFIGKLRDMTNLDFALPSVEEWEYAAKGGEHNETTLFVGNSNANLVAWYKENSGGVPHPSDGQQGLEPNMLDLYDMSGNVGELCNTPFEINTPHYTVCGGNFNSPITEITTTSRAPFNVNEKDTTVGFRIVMHCYPY